MRVFFGGQPSLPNEITFTGRRAKPGLARPFRAAASVGVLSGRHFPHRYSHRFEQALKRDLGVVIWTAGKMHRAVYLPELPGKTAEELHHINQQR